MKEHFSLDDLVRVAKRENNNKRPFLYVNPCQGKHVPVSPQTALGMFSSLASIVEDRYQSERLLVVGFSETATAIGSAIAVSAKNVDYYLSTTRESVPNSNNIIFSESHSHATEQRLVANGLEQIVQRVQRIVFAEDEVTTGNTIEGLIRELQSLFPERQMKFGIISILNSMSNERIHEMNCNGVCIDYLYHIEPLYKATTIDKYEYLPLSHERYSEISGIKKHFEYGSTWNHRIVTSTGIITQECDEFADRILSNILLEPNAKQLLVLGTEEFMYPALKLGHAIESANSSMNVFFHATTRSPIEVSNSKEYPLHNRFEIPSLYECSRKTFVYNLTKYDQVLVITDAIQINKNGLCSLVGALERAGNDSISFVEWKLT